MLAALLDRNQKSTHFAFFFFFQLQQSASASSGVALFFSLLLRFHHLASSLLAQDSQTEIGSGHLLNPRETEPLIHGIATHSKPRKNVFFFSRRCLLGSGSRIVMLVGWLLFFFSVVVVAVFGSCFCLLLWSSTHTTQHRSLRLIRSSSSNQNSSFRTDTGVHSSR